MKQILSIVVLLATCFSFNFLASCKGKPTEQPQTQPVDNKIEYTKEATFPKIEGLNLGVYERPKDYKFTVDDGQKLLNRLRDLSRTKTQFKVNEEMQRTGETWYNSPQDPSAAARINQRNGDLSFNEGMSRYRGDKATPGLLTAAAAEQRAKEYLKQLELPVKDNDWVVAHVGGVNLGIHENDATKVVEKFTTVRFDRQLDGIPVYGHSRIVFQLAEEGRINSFFWQWSPLEKREPGKEALRMNPDEMKKQLEDAVLQENTEAQKIRIESIQLVYFDDGSGVIEPALHIKGKTLQTGRDRKDEFPYDTVIPLLKSPQAKYPFNHRAEKRPNDLDNSNQAPEIPRSPDERGKE